MRNLGAQALNHPLMRETPPLATAAFLNEPSQHGAAMRSGQRNFTFAAWRYRAKDVVQKIARTSPPAEPALLTQRVLEFLAALD